MKFRAFICVVMCIVILCACGENNESQIEGTWYSVEDEKMYSFSDGVITYAGNNVGQYDETTEYIVISLIDMESNLKLYVTVDGSIEVLADSQNEDGEIYFCRGLENAKKYIEERKKEEQLLLEAEEEQRLNSLHEYKSYLENNIFGTWVADDESKNVVKIIFSEDMTMEKYDQYGNSEKLYIIDMSVGIEDDVPVAEICVADDKEGTDPGCIYITMQEDTYTNNRVEIYSWTFTKELYQYEDDTWLFYYLQDNIPGSWISKESDSEISRIDFLLDDRLIRIEDNEGNIFEYYWKDFLLSKDGATITFSENIDDEIQEELEITATKNTREEDEIMIGSQIFVKE